MRKLPEMVALWREAHNGPGESTSAARVVWMTMSSGERESLRQLLFASAPVWDGDHITKVGRDGLLEAGLATRVCHLGEQGFTSATYAAYSIYRANHTADELRAAQIEARRRHRNAAVSLTRKRWLRMWPWSRAKSLDALLQKADG